MTQVFALLANGKTGRWLTSLSAFPIWVQGKDDALARVVFPNKGNDGEKRIYTGCDVVNSEMGDEMRRN